MSLERNGRDWYYYCHTWRKFKIGGVECRRALRLDTVRMQVAKWLSSILRPPKLQKEPTIASPPIISPRSSPISFAVFHFDEHGNSIAFDPNAIRSAVVRFNAAVDSAPDFESMPLKLRIAKLTAQRENLINAIALGADAGILAPRLNSTEQELQGLAKDYSRATAQIRHRFSKLDPNTISKHAQDLFDALCANNGEAIRLLLPAVVSDVIISFSFAERS